MYIPFNFTLLLILKKNLPNNNQIHSLSPSLSLSLHCPPLRCHIRVIDTFGTEPAYNHEEYATLNGYRTNWGYWNLHGQQYMTMFRKCCFEIRKKKKSQFWCVNTEQIGRVY